MVGSPERFILTYAFFLFFLVFLIGLGLGDMFAGNIAGLTAPTPPAQSDSSFIGLLNFFGFLVDNIGFFFILMTVDTGIAFLGLLIFSPAIIILIYLLLKLIRGGG